MSKIYGIGDEEELAEDLQKELFELKRNPNIIEIPDNATNGEVIKALFPDSELHKEPDYISLTIKNGVEIVAYIEDRGASWWFAPYKENKEK